MADSPETKSQALTDAVVEEYLRRVDAGEKVDQAAFIAEHPDLAPALTSFFANEQLMRKWTTDSRVIAADTTPKDAQPTIPPKSASPLALAAGMLKLPANMGRYRIDKELGRGAMGAVYLAHDSELDRQVALKIPKFSGDENPDLIARFLREARSAAGLAHPNICRVYDVSEHQGVRYIAMEYIDGKPLSAFIAGGNVQPKQAANVIRKLAEGLAEAHQRGIIHRDLKPDNILIKKNGEPVLTDFGLARANTAGGPATATQDGMILGSPAYMPPEQAAGQLSEMGPSSDVYSLGVVLYELVTGEIPFRGSVVEVLASVLTKTPKSVREVKPSCDPGLAAICDKMMARKPANRYQSMHDVAAAINDWLKTPGASKPADDPAKSKLGTPHVVQPKKQGEPAGQSLLLKEPAKSQASIAPTTSKTPSPKPADGVGGTAKTSKVPERTPQQLKELAELVEQLLARNDYLEAIPILEQIPDYQRTPKLRQLLGEGYELKETVAKLEQRLEKYLNQLDIPELKKTVTALLKIHPSHPRGREIRKALNTEGKKGVIKILKDEGNYHGGGLAWEPWQIGAALGTVALLFVAVSYAVFVYIKGATGTLEIRVDDPTAIVKVDGNTATISSDGVGEMRITYGTHNYTVERNGEMIIANGTHEFKKDGNKVLTITLNQSKPAVVDGGTVASSSPSDINEKVFNGHTAGVLSVAISPDSQFVYSGSEDQTVRSWDVASGKERWQYATGGENYGLAVSPNGKLVAIGSKSGFVVVDAATGKDVKKFTGPNARIQGVAFTPDGTQIGTAGVDSAVRLWDLASGNELRLYQQSGNTYTGVRISQDGNEIFAGSGASTIEAWDLKSGTARESFTGAQASFVGINLSPDGTKIAGASNDKTVGLWDRQSRKLIHRFPHADRAMDAAFFPSGKHIVTGGLDKKMIVWNLDTQQKEKEWSAHDSSDSLGVRSVAVAPNGQFIASGGYDSKVRIWKSPIAAPALPSGDAPPLAVAPFNAVQAKAHQEAWAKHLGVPVEYTNSIGMKFQLIPPGEFFMGLTQDEYQTLDAERPNHGAGSERFEQLLKSEIPQRRIRITKPFYLGMHEVTQNEYGQLMGKNPSHFSAIGEGKSLIGNLDTGRFPVESMTWNGAAEFCLKLSEKEGLSAGYAVDDGNLVPRNGDGYRLPTEAEWEFSCRAGTTSFFWTGGFESDVASAAWCNINAERRTHPVGELRANPFGLFDVHGNAFEFVQDGFAFDGYEKDAGVSPVIDPQGPQPPGQLRVFRSGNYRDGPYFGRSAARLGYGASDVAAIGFRVALPVDAVKQALAAAPNSVPPFAIAPFNAAQAKAHQEAWAKHLGVPVEYTNSIGMKFRLIPPSEFTMGGTPEEIKEWAAQWDQNDAEQKDIARAEGPQHTVRLTKPYYLGMHEVTQQDYQTIMGSNPSEYQAKSRNPNGANLVQGLDTKRFPVESVSWIDVQEFCQKLSQKDDNTYRLPTEAEWENGCRAGTTTRNWNGDSAQAAAEAANIELGRPRTVGEMKGNPFGLYDMNGNVWEWVQDWWDPDYYQQFASQTAVDPTGPASGKWRAYRGCSLGQDALRARSALRFRDGPAQSAGGLGFRVVLSVEGVKGNLPAGK